ncbi:MAG: signal peptidase I [Caulobacteraceae bacterium]
MSFSESDPELAGGASVRNAIEFLLPLGLGLAVALVGRVLVFEPFSIPSSSMEPGLVTGDYVVASKWTYGWSRASLPFDPPAPPGRIGGRLPRRGEVIVFRLPREPAVIYVKRLIGLPGDRVQVVHGGVLVNGRTVPRVALGWVHDHDAPDRIVPRVMETAPDGRRYVTFGGAQHGQGDNTAVYIVPAGMYFFMGDNRDNSLDSRWPTATGVGFVPADNIVGRAEVVLMSWRGGASVSKPWTWLRPDFGRFFQAVR